MKLGSDERTTRPSLLVRVKTRSDQDAWHEFVEIYGPVIFGYCRIRKLQESDAADVAQDVLVRLSNSMGDFEYQPEIGRFRNWLGKVVYREILRHWNKRKRDGSAIQGMVESETSDVPQSDWIDYFQAEIMRSSLQNIASEFEPETMALFELTWIKNLTAAQAAEQTKTTVDKVYVAKSRVLKRLQQEVIRLTDDLPVAGL
jgi:RNA polymerase sigma-70 factor (ECF subfamily)